MAHHDRDPEVADKVHDLLGGDAPAEWPAKGEDNLEVFTASSSVEVILSGADSIRQRMVLWGRSGKPIYTSDGFTKDDGTPDPDAELSFQERKQRGKDGIGPVPDINITFRLAEEPDLGIFRFKTGAWSMAQDLVREGTLDRLAAIDGPTKGHPHPRGGLVRRQERPHERQDGQLHQARHKARWRTRWRTGRVNESEAASEILGNGLWPAISPVGLTGFEPATP
ncbi:hypothetical protein J7E25_04530 [Agromyces sp. ISL-38]|uniref:recombination directionality factor n=1 Tax=Agromyces sp. ISL-38 TaxID=2819107 RepID=UPI001BED19B8|nr:hypothetical protein [Agromyces sp. ISL-38]MBT2498352.1 hypothetical protein [Agromyces sp. ISL-38]MBT2519014.1 hypothetical protein [Streptomyces sp. ISL-90]